MYASLLQWNKLYISYLKLEVLTMACKLPNYQIAQLIIN